MDEAIDCLRKATELDPKNPAPHLNLGAYLCDEKRQFDEAIKCFKKVLEFEPKEARAYANLAVVSRHLGKQNEAMDLIQKSIEMNPKVANAHNILGAIFLDDRRDPDRAILCFKKAIELDPGDAHFHVHLGHALVEKGQLDDAIASYKTGIETSPNSVDAHASMGIALGNKGQKAEAIEYYKKAIELAQQDPRTYAPLARALAHQGRFAESLAAFQRGHELGSKHPGWTFPSAQWVREAEMKAAIAAKVPAFVKGEFRPADNKERLALIAVCQAKKLHQTTSELYRDAFAADPKLVDDLKAGHCYNAACESALAAASLGKDTAKLDDTERARLRRQTLEWLRADLVLRDKELATGTPAARDSVQQTMRHWRNDADLAGVREAEFLSKLPAEEQKQFTQLWADVASLLQKAEVKTK